MGAAPFLGYFILVEDAAGSRVPVKEWAPHFPTDKIFQGGSYQTRMMLLCERMVQHQLYACASVLVAAGGAEAGVYATLTAQTSFRNLLSKLAAHLSTESSLVTDNGQLQEPQASFGMAVDFDGTYFEVEE